MLGVNSKQAWIQFVLRLLQANNKGLQIQVFKAILFLFFILWSFIEQNWKNMNHNQYAWFLVPVLEMHDIGFC